MQYSESVLEEIRRALINDPGFKFKQAGNNLRGGECPNCHEPECFVDLNKPYRVSCGRINNCKWSASVRELYPEILENLSHRHPVTPDKPNAPADAYLQEVRGFDLNIIKDMYSLNYAKHTKKEEFYPAVKVGITQTTYWLRIINADDIRKFGAKSKIIGGYQGIGWVPPGMTFEEGDEVWITEGIFKSMAFLHIGKKSISGLSASNLPRDIIKANKGKKIVWVVAEDADEAGQNAAAKFRKEIDDMGEICRVAFPANADEDWDDVFRDGRLNKQYMQDSFWRGFYHLAESYQRKAFFHYCKYKYTHSVIDFQFALYRYKLDDRVQNDIDNNLNGYPDPEKGWNIGKKNVDDFFAKFTSVTEIKKICPCKPEFLYIEEDYLTKERTNTFYVEFANHTPSMLLSADGTIYKNADNFSNGLLRYTGFAPFTGNNSDLNILHERWFNKRIKFVTSVDILGYEPESKTYLFPHFAYSGGSYQPVNKHGFFVFDRKSLKCTYNSAISIIKNTREFNGDWINDFYHAFDLNGMILLSWWLGTLFACQIRSRHASWPFLEYTGKPGSGKSLQLRFLWRTMGITSTSDWEGIDPRRESGPACARKMARFSNLPTVLIESEREKHDCEKKERKSYDFSELKPLYNGGVLRSIGVKTTGTETKEFVFRGGICISQNAEVDGERAVLERIVQCICTQDHFTTENEKMAGRLNQMDAVELGGFLHAVLRNERQLLDGFFRDYEKVKQQFQEHDNVTGTIKNYRLIHNHAQIAAWARQLTFLFGSRLNDNQLQRIEDHIWQRAVSRRERLSSEHPYVEQFWEVYDYLNEQKGQYGTQQSLNHADDSKLIAINMPQFQEIAASHRQNVASTTELIPLLKFCRRYPCLGQRPVRSTILNKVVKCWVFKTTEDKKE